MCFLNSFFPSLVSLQKGFAHFLLIRNNGENNRINHFQTDDIFHIIDQIKVQIYRCESAPSLNGGSPEITKTVLLMDLSVNLTDC